MIFRVVTFGSIEITKTDYLYAIPLCQILYAVLLNDI